MEDEAFYKHVLNSMRDMVLVKGAESRLVWANKSFLDYYGMTEDELKGIVDGIQSDPDDTLQYVRDDKLIFDTQKDLNILSEPVTNSDGEVNYFHTIKSPIFDNDTMIQSVGVSRRIEDQDIQQQKLTELDAKVFTAPLRSIIDSYPIATILMDHDQRIIKCNSKWSELFGDAPSISNINFSEHYQNLGDLVKSAKESLSIESEVGTVVHIETKNGSEYFDFKTSIWKYPDGTIGGTMIVATDVTSIKKNEEALRQTQKEHRILNRRLVLALKASEVGVWEWDLITNELIWDPQMYRLYGIEEKDFEGAYPAWEKGLHPEDKERSVTEIEDAVSGISKFDTEFRVLWPSGTVRNIRALADVVRDQNGKALKLVGVNWDITAVKESESKLRQANEELSDVNGELAQFAYRTSHDLKAPLTTSKTLAEFTLKDIDSGNLDEAKNNTGKIVQQMQRLEDLVTDILSLAKADFGEPVSHPVNFPALIQRIEEKLVWMDEDRKLSIGKEFNTSREFLGDDGRICQVLENLISNSIKYSDKQKPEQIIEVRVSDQDAGILITVKDNGIGIPEAYKADVFKMFKRFHPKIATGSGLGLSIVKKNVDRMGGEITVSSSSDGTCFSISIPNGVENV